MQPVDELFVKLPYVVLADPELTPSEKIVYACLRIWARVERGRFTLKTGNSTIAKACKLGKSTVKTALSKLTAKGLIARIGRSSGKEQMTSRTTICKISSVDTPDDLPQTGRPEISLRQPEAGHEVDVPEVDVERSQKTRAPSRDLFPPAPSKTTRNGHFEAFRDWYSSMAKIHPEMGTPVADNRVKGNFWKSWKAGRSALLKDTVMLTRGVERMLADGTKVATLSGLVNPNSDSIVKVAEAASRGDAPDDSIEGKVSW
jgi:predicted transcriptional regulator